MMRSSMTAVAKAMTAEAKSPGEATVSSHFARPLMRAIAVAGGPAGAPLTRLANDDPSSRIPRALAAQIWNDAARTADCSAIGIRAALETEPGTFGLLELAARSSRNLRKAFDRLDRFHPLLNDSARVALEVDGDWACLHYIVPGSDTPPPYLEFILASWAIAARQMIGGELSAQAEFPHDAPRESELHRAVFDGGVRFGAPQAELRIPRSFLEFPLTQSDTRLRAALDSDAELLMREIRRRHTWREKVGCEIGRRLPHGEPKLGEVARALAASERTLRRRLEEEGCTFSAILETTRRSLALSLLEDDEMSIDAISTQLGFSEPSAFRRAFQRWTRSTPNRIRAMHTAPA